MPLQFKTMEELLGRLPATLPAHAAQHAPEVMAPPSEPSALGKLSYGALSTLGALGNIIDLPASSVRDLLTLNNPLDQWMHPISGEDRIYGRDMLQEWGMLGPNTSGLDAGDIAGFGAEVLLDPFTYLTAGAAAVTRGGKVAKMIKALPKADLGPTGKLVGKGYREKMLSNTLDDMLKANPKLEDAARTAAEAQGKMHGDVAGWSLDAIRHEPLSKGPAWRVPGLMKDPIHLGTGGRASKALNQGFDIIGSKMPTMPWSMGPQATRVTALAAEHFGPESDAVMSVMKSRAKRWSKVTGRKSDEWFERIQDIRSSELSDVAPPSKMDIGPEWVDIPDEAVVPPGAVRPATSKAIPSKPSENTPGYWLPEQGSANAPDINPRSAKEGSGWKLHLAVNEHNMDAVEQALIAKGVKFKRGKGGDAGKEFTIYLGGKDKADRIAGELTDEIDHLLEVPSKNMNDSGDIVLSGKVGGRFDPADSDFTQYGVEGSPVLFEDAKSFAMRKGDAEQAVSSLENVPAQFRRNAQKELEKRYGEFYTGGASRGSIDFRTNPTTGVKQARTLDGSTVQVDVPGNLADDLLQQSGHRKSMRGEYWLEGGTARFADGDVGDLNHEGMVMNRAASDVIEALQEAGESDLARIIDEGRGDPIMVRDSFGNHLDAQGVDIGDVAIEDFLAEKTGLNRRVIEAVTSSTIDARTVGMEDYNWVRMAGNNIEVHGLTRGRLEEIADGLFDTGELEDLSREAFDIYDFKTKKFYNNVPFDVIAAGDMKALRDFGKDVFGQSDDTLYQGARVAIGKGRPATHRLTGTSGAPYNVMVNPSRDTIKKFLTDMKAKYGDDSGARILINRESGELYAWDAHEAIHQQVLDELGLDSFSFVQEEISAVSDFTNAMKRARRQMDMGPLYQGAGGGPKGAAEFLADGKVIIHAFKGSDISTFAHETAHVFRRDLADSEPKLLAQVEEAIGVTDGAWTREAEEEFATGFERYLRDGTSPTPLLRQAFEKLKAWMTEIYADLKGTPLEKEVSPELRTLFDQMLTPERRAIPGAIDELFNRARYSPAGRSLAQKFSIPVRGTRSGPGQVEAAKSWDETVTARQGIDYTHARRTQLADSLGLDTPEHRILTRSTGEGTFAFGDDIEAGELLATRQAHRAALVDEMIDAAELEDQEVFSDLYQQVLATQRELVDEAFERNLAEIPGVKNLDERQRALLREDFHDLGSDNLRMLMEERAIGMKSNPMDDQTVMHIKREHNATKNPVTGKAYRDDKVFNSQRDELRSRLPFLRNLPAGPSHAGGSAAVEAAVIDPMLSGVATRSKDFVRTLRQARAKNQSVYGTRKTVDPIQPGSKVKWGDEWDEYKEVLSIEDVDGVPMARVAGIDEAIPLDELTADTDFLERVGYFWENYLQRTDDDWNTLVELRERSAKHKQAILDGDTAAEVASRLEPGEGEVLQAFEDLYKQSEEAVKWLAKLDPDYVLGEQDHQLHMASHAQAMAGVKAIIRMVGRNGRVMGGDGTEIMNLMKDNVLQWGGDVLSEDRAYSAMGRALRGQQHGLPNEVIDALVDAPAEIKRVAKRLNEIDATDPGNANEITELTARQSALETAFADAKMALKQIEVERELADDIRLAAALYKSKVPHNFFTKLYDQLGNLFRSHVTTPWPAFHSRNTMTAVWIQLITGSYDPAVKGGWMNPAAFLKPLRDMHRFVKEGKLPDDWREFPMFKDRDMTHAEAVAEWRAALHATEVAPAAHLFTTTQLGEESPIIGDLLEELAGMPPSATRLGTQIDPGIMGWNIFKKGVPRSLDQANPLKVAGGMAGGEGDTFWQRLFSRPKEDTFAPVRAGRELGSYVEEVNRFATVWAKMKQGYSLEAASDISKAGHVQYKYNTQFERQWMKRIFPFYQYCMPTDHEILTRRGWKTSETAIEGEDVLTLNHNTGECVWEPLEAINVFDFDGELYSTVNRGSDFQFTKDHTWPAFVPAHDYDHELQDGSVSTYTSIEQRKMLRASELSKHHGVPRTAEFNGSESVLSVRHAAILGWIVGDGYFRWRGNHCEMMVYQSPKKHLDEIIQLLGTKPRKPHPTTGVVCVPVSNEDGKAITKIFRGYGDLVEIVTHLSRDAADAMYDSLFKAEGTTVGPNDREFFYQDPQINPTVLEAFQILCTLTGRYANTNKYGASIGKSHCSYIQRNMKEVHYRGQVWCPTTPSGTWLCRHKGKVIWTGNSRFQIPFQLRMLYQRPGGLTAQTIRTGNRMRGDSPVPPEISGTLAIPLGGESEEGNQKYLLGLDLPHELFGDVVKVRPTATGSLGDSLLSLVGMMNPVIKAPLEQAFGRQAFSGRDLRDLNSRIGTTIQNVTGMERAPRVPQLVDQFVSSSPAARAMSTVGTLTDPRKREMYGLPLMANLLTGARVKDVDLSKTKIRQERELLEDLLRPLPESYHYGRLVIRKEDLEKLTPQERMMYEAYKMSMKPQRK
jgi:hypothetical protein